MTAEVLNNALCNEENACNPLCVTAEVLNNAVTDECLRMYKSSGFLRLPRYPMLVNGTMIDFMVDSGAARSTIRPCDLPCEPRMTDLVFKSTSASGHTISENYTVPLKCETEGGRALKHAFLCSGTCPVPLMARDLMCKLNLKLTAGPFGIVIEEEQQMSCAKFEPQWAYEWQIRDSDWAQMILKLAKDRTVSANTENMLPDRLHCTSHVVIEREPQYEEEWFNGAENEKIRFDKIFWNENVCALSACLSEKLMQLYLITGESAPHLSVTKGTEQTWAASGLFVRKCMIATDWAEKGNGVKHSENVDDLLICARDEATCVADTVTLLNHLAQEGHKVSLTKLQFVKQEITFLGHTITPNSKAISEKRVKAIKDVPRPITKKQLLSFLGMCAYCRTFIPNYAFLEKPLRALTTGKGLRSCDKIDWPTEAQEAFANMKMQLAQAPTLGLPAIERPFTQMVDEKHGFMSSVLLQTHGDRLRPVAYFSTKLDAVAAGLPHCLRAVAAAELAVLASREFVGYSDFTLMVPHAVSMILQEQKTSHLSTARWLRYHTILLDMPNVTVKRCTTLNPATLLPTEEDGEEHHCCLSVLEQVCTPRPDLLYTPLENCDNVLFVDGSASKDPQTGLNKVGFAVTNEFEVVKSGKLPSNYSAQAAELVALTEACKLMADKCVTIYTDSRYAFGVTHDFGALWKHRNFLKSDGHPILNASLVSEHSFTRRGCDL